MFLGSFVYTGSLTCPHCSHLKKITFNWLKTSLLIVTTPLTKRIIKKITFDELTQMHESKLSNIIHNGKLLNSDKHLREDVGIRLVTSDSYSVSNFVKLRQNDFWL